jgi:hypothetical protein
MQKPGIAHETSLDIDLIDAGLNARNPASQMKLTAAKSGFIRLMGRH